MSGTTPELNLPTAQGSDDLALYLKSNPGGLDEALTTIDSEFSATTGHAHDGPHKGKPIGTAAIASGITLTSPILNSPTSNSPTLNNPTFTGTVKGQAAWFDPVMLVHI
jgi:hypothetical protein